MKRIAFALAALLLAACAHAHLMPAQRGTLNVAANGAYLVLSVPVSAFQGIDDDGDGHLSVAEARTHREQIEAQVRARVQLTGAAGALPLEGMMLSLASPDDAPAAPAAQVVVLGRFPVADAGGLQLRIDLFGRAAQERQYDVTITRGADAQLARFTPERVTQRLFRPAAAAFAEAAREGALHVLGGWDHLLFLLVVLLAGGAWRAIAVTLSVFMLGHAITVAAAGLGVVRLPASIVEPAIAATIVTLAVFDAWRARRTRPLPETARLALVFTCALIHGLGLATGFLELGLDLQHRVLALAGFNLGIEAAQLAIAGLFLGALAALRACIRYDRVQWNISPHS